MKEEWKGVGVGGAVGRGSGLGLVAKGIGNIIIGMSSNYLMVKYVLRIVVSRSMI